MFAAQKATYILTQIGVLSVTVDNINIRAQRPHAVKVRKQASFLRRLTWIRSSGCHQNSLAIVLLLLLQFKKIF